MARSAALKTLGGAGWSYEWYGRARRPKGARRGAAVRRRANALDGAIVGFGGEENGRSQITWESCSELSRSSDNVHAMQHLREVGKTVSPDSLPYVVSLDEFQVDQLDNLPSAIDGLFLGGKTGSCDLLCRSLLDPQ